jgi:hypothetical protein
VWKRMADENQQSANFLARIGVALAVMLLAIGAYAFSANSRYNDLCTTIEARTGTATATPAREFGESIASSYCG